VTKQFISDHRGRRSSRTTIGLVLAASLILFHSGTFAAEPGRSGDRDAYVVMNAGSDSSTMSGSLDDIRRAKALRVGREALLYFRHDGASYVIRDADTLRRAAQIFEPQQQLGARQAELGSRQAALGSKQAAFGAQQARMGVRQAEATPTAAAALGEQQEELGRQQDALGRQQDELGKQQDVLGREQDRLAAEAEIKFRALVREALGRGLAQRVN
jgi:bla regulator protein BlaR1